MVDSASDAICSGSLDGTIRTWNRGAELLYGYTAEEIIGRSFMRLVPAEQLPRSQELHANVAAGKPPVPEIDTFAIRKDGSKVPVSLSISPLTDEEGRLTGAVVIGRDISKRRALMEQRREARERFTAAFERAPIGMALVSLEGRFLDANRSLCDLLGRSKEELEHLTFQELTHPEDLEQDLSLLRALLDGRVPSYEMEKRYLLPDGEIVWGQLCVSLVRDAEGEPHHFVSQIKDITALKQQDLELRRLASHLRDLSLHDPLTGLGNPRAFESALGAALEDATEDFPVTLILIDLDELKAHNLAHGRAAGDRELVTIAGALRSAAGPADVAFRIGGDEFAMLVGAENDGEAVSDAITRCIAESPAEVRAATAIVRAPEHGTTRAELLERADLSLRAADAVESLPLPSVPAGQTPAAPSRQALDSLCSQLGLSAACLCEAGVVRVASAGCGALGLLVGEPPPSSSPPPALSVSIEGPGGVAEAIVHLHGAAGVAPPGPEAAGLIRFAGTLARESLTREAAEALQRTADLELSGVAALVAALEARDHYTAEHSRGVVALAAAVAHRLGLDSAEIATVERVAVLHDVGKVAVPDAILQKRGPLTPSEWELMRQHPAVGERIVASTRTLAHLAAPIRAEHERWDGGGYPDGLRGEDIPIASRITLACDAYSAMTSARPYRAAMSEEQARAELLANAGSQFDPAVVDALLQELVEATRKELP